MLEEFEGVALPLLAAVHEPFDFTVGELVLGLVATAPVVPVHHVRRLRAVVDVDQQVAGWRLLVGLGGHALKAEREWWVDPGQCDLFESLGESFQGHWAQRRRDALFVVTFVYPNHDAASVDGEAREIASSLTVVARARWDLALELKAMALVEKAAIKGASEFVLSGGEPSGMEQISHH